MVPAADVRAALQFVARGECEYGIVYRTDLRAADVRAIAQIPGGYHQPILYTAALIGAPNQAAVAFFEFLFSEQARLIYRAAGFLPVPHAERS